MASHEKKNERRTRFGEIDPRADSETSLMARGKYLSLEEARKGETKGETIERFCKEHPLEGDEKQFDRVFERMAKAEKEKAPDK